MTTIVVNVVGGVVDGIWSDTKGIECVVVDWDNIEDDPQERDRVQDYLNGSRNGIDRTKYPYSSFGQGDATER